MATDVAWPTFLPKMLLDTHGFRPRPPVVRTDMDQGHARQRRRSQSTPTEVPFSLVLEEWQMAIFESFVDFKLNYGATWFSVDLLSAIGMVAHEARLLGGGDLEYKELTPKLWRVTGTLEVRERPMLSEEELDFLLAAGGDPEGFFALIEAYRIAINYGFPLA